MLHGEKVLLKSDAGSGARVGRGAGGAFGVVGDPRTFLNDPRGGSTAFSGQKKAAYWGEKLPPSNQRKPA